MVNFNNNKDHLLSAHTILSAIGTQISWLILLIEESQTNKQCYTAFTDTVTEVCAGKAGSGGHQENNHRYESGGCLPIRDDTAQLLWLSG